MADKKCFFISPIDDEGSDIRERSNTVKEDIIQPVVTEYGYEVQRSDDINETGSVTKQIIQETIESELVVADLTNHNPNVFYELAVRHATGKPLIQLIQSEQSIPFDLQNDRTVFYGLRVDEAKEAVEAVEGLVENIEDGGGDSDNPVSRAVNLTEVVDNMDSSEKEILNAVQNLSDQVSRLEEKVTQSGDGVHVKSVGTPDDEVTEERLNELRKRLNELKHN